MSAPWPRLSEDLTGPEHPEKCQSCGADGVLDAFPDALQLRRWTEHNEQDHPENIVVVLCRHCSDVLIEPHPRLYAPVPMNTARPGCMAICSACTWRDGVECRHPRLKTNGGAGLEIKLGQSSVMFLDGQGKGGRRRGWMEKQYATPPSACAGREVKEDTQ